MISSLLNAYWTDQEIGLPWVEASPPSNVRLDQDLTALGGRFTRHVTFRAPLNTGRSPSPVLPYRYARLCTTRPASFHRILTSAVSDLHAVSGVNLRPMPPHGLTRVR